MRLLLFIIFTLTNFSLCAQTKKDPCTFTWHEFPGRTADENLEALDFNYNGIPTTKRVRTCTALKKSILKDLLYLRANYLADLAEIIESNENITSQLKGYLDQPHEYYFIPPAIKVQKTFVSSRGYNFLKKVSFKINDNSFFLPNLSTHKKWYLVSQKPENRFKILEYSEVNYEDHDVKYSTPILKLKVLENYTQGISLKINDKHSDARSGTSITTSLPSNLEITKLFIYDTDNTKAEDLNNNLTFVLEELNPSKEFKQNPHKLSLNTVPIIHEGKIYYYSIDSITTISNILTWLKDKIKIALVNKSITKTFLKEFLKVAPTSEFKLGEKNPIWENFVRQFYSLIEPTLQNTSSTRPSAENEIDNTTTSSVELTPITSLTLGESTSSWTLFLPFDVTSKRINYSEAQLSTYLTTAGCTHEEKEDKEIKITCPFSNQENRFYMHFDNTSKVNLYLQKNPSPQDCDLKPRVRNSESGTSSEICLKNIENIPGFSIKKSDGDPVYQVGESDSV